MKPKAMKHPPSSILQAIHNSQFTIHNSQFIIPLQRASVVGVRAGIGPTVIRRLRQQRDHTAFPARTRTAPSLGAVRREDYGEAARLRDALRTADPRAALEQALAAAVAAEDYAAACGFRDELRLLGAAEASTSSEATTDGVRVAVQSFFVPERSLAGENYFAYRVVIENVDAPGAVQLRARHWVITHEDEQGDSCKQDEVRGPGVVGEHPVLEPGERFEYMSASVLKTARGYMEGEFEFELRQGFCPPLVFEAEIARFLLDTDICEQL